ncbi:MAG TPA: glutamine--fructose-6-phosphate transaminase (isomerizing) [Candidatus Pelagibacter sp.]|jgi:glucosamine--fructose-6-phosphate aminotransferase (isomerizing)|nr:glutamine--fructose-6-phosphate transaminase (isomerizing) [Candidatus Pelagibacter sp.]
MCGIIGIASNKVVTENIIQSLKKLEYRGYDSAGISTIINNTINEKKCTGTVDNLEKILFKNPSNGLSGIGHVRWATHGIPNQVNAHPHSSEEVSVVHNGIIENSTELKKILEAKGYNFKSQTDTEVITFLLTDFLKDFDLINAINKTLDKLIGSFALGIIFKKYDSIVVGARRGSPLAVGYGVQENYLGSDSYALKSMTNKITYLDDGDVCILSKDKIEFYNSKNKKVNKKILTLSNDKFAAEKGNYKDFMSKEINEQSTTVKTCIKEYVDQLRRDVNLYNFPLEPSKIKKIILVGCGTAFNACATAKYWFEELTDITIEIDIASEFRYRNIKFDKKNLYIFISQSGETADTFAALDLCKKNKVKTCSVVNVVESSIARSSDFVLPIHAGPEIGVASTKAFLGQLLVLYILAIKISETRNQINKNDYEDKIKDLLKLPDLIKETLKCDDRIQIIAKEFLKAKGAMFLGRGLSYPLALEGALKLKELSYLHAEGYAAGEMKHGPLALIEEGLPVVILAPKDRYFEKTISNMQEVIARGGKVILISNKNNIIISENVRFTLEIPKSDDNLMPFLMTIPLQLLAYHVASLKNCNIDKPRNLAKSVTVE